MYEQLKTWDSVSKKGLEQLFGGLQGECFQEKVTVSGCCNQKGNLLGGKYRVGPGGNRQKIAGAFEINAFQPEWPDTDPSSLGKNSSASVLCITCSRQVLAEVSY